MRKLGILLALCLALGTAVFAQTGVTFFPGPGLTTSAATGWCSTIPQSGLVNCWPMDTANTTSSTATDVIGAKNATLTNVTINGSGPGTALNNAISCNGTSSRGDTTLANIPTAAFSIVMWVNTASVANPRAMANDHTDSDNKGFEAIVSTSPLAWFGNGTSAGNATIGAISASTWAMVSWTYDGTNLKSYRNTTNAATVAFTGPVVAGTANISFCVNPAYNGDWYPGLLAGVALYSRAITATEVTNIHAIP